MEIDSRKETMQEASSSARSSSLFGKLLGVDNPLQDRKGVFKNLPLLSLFGELLG